MSKGGPEPDRERQVWKYRIFGIAASPGDPDATAPG
jgi:hypothetical protein